MAKKGPQPTPGLVSPWYSKADVALLFAVSVRTIETWMTTGRLPAPIKRGRRWTMWPRAVIDALIADWSKEGGAA